MRPGHTPCAHVVCDAYATICGITARPRGAHPRTLAPRSTVSERVNGAESSQTPTPTHPRNPTRTTGSLTGAVRLQTRDGVDPEAFMPRTVLVVDDDADMRLYLRSCLRTVSTPFDQVIEAADGLEAWRLVRSGTVDLVISDVALPGLDGHRLSRAIRDDATLAHVSVLLISGESVLGDSRADGFLLKPFNTHQLLAALSRLPSRRDGPP